MNPRIVRAITHPLRHRLLFEYADGDLSPSKVAARLQKPVNLVSYHTRVLLNAGCIELVRTERRRGAVEHFYRAVMLGEIPDEDWQCLALRARRAIVRSTLDLVWQDLGNALSCGGMDGASAHLSRTLLKLDARGQEELAALLHATLAEARRIEKACADRDGAPTELVVLGFRRPSAP